MIYSLKLSPGTVPTGGIHKGFVKDLLSVLSVGSPLLSHLRGAYHDLSFPCECGAAGESEEVESPRLTLPSSLQTQPTQPLHL
jgi:hypothetical protein